MSLQISSAFVTLFDAEVKQAYQGQRALAGLIRERSGVEGSTVKFPKIGKGVAMTRIPQADVTPLNVSYAQVTATMQDYIAAEYSDIFNQQKVNFDDRRELVQVVSGAIGRRMDQLVIGALEASGTTLTVDEDLGGTNASLNVAKLRRAKRLLDANNVPMEGRVAVIHARSLEGLLGETAATSADFNSVRALVAGEINTFLGFRFVTLGDRDEGGLGFGSANIRQNWFFHRDAVGMGIGMNSKTEINYVPEKTSFLVASMFSAGAVAIDAEGIVKVETYEA